MNKKPALLFLLILISLPSLYAQTTPVDPAMSSTQFDMTGFPLWAKDLRRGSIVAFGAFPFMYFFSSFGVGTYRWVSNSNGSIFSAENRRYAPWPFESAGSIPKTQRQKVLTLGIAAGGSVLIAFIDYGIQLHKRKVKEREALNYPEGVPIIIRSPLNAEEAAAPDSGAGSP